MLRTPLFTATVVLTVAIAIAANATIFTVVNAVMIRSLPFAQPDRIMQVAARGDPMVGVAGGVRGNSSGAVMPGVKESSGSPRVFTSGARDLSAIARSRFGRSLPTPEKRLRSG